MGLLYQFSLTSILEFPKLAPHFQVTILAGGFVLAAQPLQPRPRDGENRVRRAAGVDQPLTLEPLILTDSLP